MLIAEAQELHWAQAVQQYVLPESVMQHLLFLTDVGSLTFFKKKKTNKTYFIRLMCFKNTLKKVYYNIFKLLNLF